MSLSLRTRLLGLGVVTGATALALGIGAPWAGAAPARADGASTKAWVMAWRQSGRSLLVAYRVTNTTASKESVVCHVKAKPSTKISKPGYYTLRPGQTFTIPAAGKESYIGVLRLPALPKGSHVAHVWASC